MKRHIRRRGCLKSPVRWFRTPEPVLSLPKESVGGHWATGVPTPHGAQCVKHVPPDQPMPSTGLLGWRVLY